MKMLCTICARGGSKGVKNKNIKDMLGIPLIGYSIQQAKDSGLFAYVAISSDSPEILNTSRQFGADILIERPLSMAADTSAKLPAIRHCLMQAEDKTGQEFDVIVDLDATSPLRDVQDIVDAVGLLHNQGADNVITACPSRKSPYFNMVELNPEGIPQLSKKLQTPVVRRQDAPQVYEMNASIYVWRRDVLLQSDSLFTVNTRLLVMPEERSVDIDSELDFHMVELLMKEKLRQESLRAHSRQP